MCPPHRATIRNILIRSPAYFNWINTAVCIITIFYRHRITEHPLCDECYADKSPYDRNQYRGYFRHLLRFGPEDEIIECALCCVIIDQFRPCSDCDICDHTLVDYLSFLDRTGDDPYNRPGTTTLPIEQRRL